MGETQVLMTVSDFSGFFLGIISWKGVSWGMCAPWGVLVLMGFLKKSQDEGGTPYAPSICETLLYFPKRLKIEITEY